MLEGRSLDSACRDFSVPPDICKQEHILCPAASIANASWVLLSPDLLVSCSYTSQVEFIVGICVFALLTAISAAIFVGRLCNGARITSEVMIKHWKNAQAFFANHQPDFSVSSLTIDLNTDVDRIEVAPA